MKAVTGVAQQLFAGAFVTPAKLYAFLFRLCHTFIDDLFVQFSISRISDVFLLNRAIHTNITILSPVFSFGKEEKA